MRVTRQAEQGALLETFAVCEYSDDEAVSGMEKLNRSNTTERIWHSVQLFDDAESLSDCVASFVSQGLSKGDHVLVAMKPELWNLTAAKLRRDDLLLPEALTSGRLTALDSRRTLQRFIVKGVLDARLFDQTVGTLVRMLTSRHARVRIYGDMVDLLATEGELAAAQRLEELWNRLGQECSFELFCGYLAPNFSDPRAARALREICDLHGQVHSTPDDILSTHLLTLCRSSVTPNPPLV
jgi:hypothetical protein